MRITIVTGFFLPVPPRLGGSTEKIWFRLTREFAALGHQVTMISRHWPGLPPTSVVDGVTHLRLPGYDHSRSLCTNLWHDAQWGLRVARHLPVADVVICNTVTLPVWLGYRRPQAGRVVVVMARMPKGHGYLYRRVDLVLALSDAVTDRLRHENPGLADRAVAFPYPIDWDLHAAAAARRDPPATVTVGYAGRIHPEKGLELLARAIHLLSARSDLPKWRLQLAGPHTVPEGGGGDSFLDTLHRLLGSEALPRLTLHGPEFDPDRLAELYRGIDIFCYPSTAEHGETFGVAVAEAMAAGCVPVVSGLACFNSLVRHDVNGLVFDHRGPDAAARLTDSLVLLLRDPALRARLARAAQEHVRQFDYAASARHVLACLARLIAS